MNTQTKKDYETLTWQLTSEDLENEFDLEISEEEIPDYQIIISIDYEQKSISYNALHKEQEMSDLSDDLEYKIKTSFVLTINYLKDLMNERNLNLKIKKIKIDDIEIELNLLRVSESFDKEFAGTINIEAKIYIIEENKKEYDSRHNWGITDQQAYKDGFVLEIRKSVDYDFCLLENVEKNDYSDILEEELKSFAEYYVLAELQHTCEKILSIYIY